MSILLEKQYLERIRNRLDCFKQLATNKWNFRCPICGDSKVSKIKARGYLGEVARSENLLYHCFNCGVSLNFSQFLEQVDPSEHRAFVLDCMREKGTYRLNKKENSEVNLDVFKTKGDARANPLYVDPILNSQYLTRLDRLPTSHECVQYVISRKLPEKFYRLMYYCSDFKRYVNENVCKKFPPNTMPDPRLFIPYFMKDGKVIAFVGRALNKNASVRYYTIKVKDSYPKIFGLDRVNYSKTIYCTEGAIDSMFLDNAIAISGSSYDNPIVESLKDNIVIVGDNERRNEQVCTLIQKMLKRGFRCVLWRDGLPFKDINEAILKGYSKEDIQKIIDEDTVSGSVGLIKFQLWKKY